VKPPVALAPLLGAVALAAGCGGGSSATPSEDPGTVMKTLIRHELAGERDQSYAMLVSEQRDVVPPQLYRSCSPGQVMDPAKVAVRILGVSDTTFTVPGRGKTAAKAVRYRIDLHDGNPIEDTGHLIAEDGHWRWTLSPQSFTALKPGNCP
jgi:hypothetical protein